MRDEHLYDVNDLYLAVQGEGVLAGVPMLIIRLQGCPVACSFCDTKETWHFDKDNLIASSSDTAEWRGRNHKWVQLKAAQIAALARSFAGDRISWILLTGGEPAQQQLRTLVYELHLMGFKVALESSGTAEGLLTAACDWVCISPKLGNPGQRPILRAALALANEIKYVIGKPADVDTLRSFVDLYADVIGSGLPAGELTEWCVQPMSQSVRATELCLELCKREGFRLSIQIHKYILTDGVDRHGQPLKDRV